MKKINILKENKDFDKIIKNNSAFKDKYYFIYTEKDTENKEDKIYKFGISVSKIIGNAVTRNFYKRRIRNIIDKKDYQNNFKCIIILRKSVLEATYSELEDSLINDFTKLKLIKESKNEKET